MSDNKVQMLQTEDQRKGSAGESAIELFFKDIGWGPIPIPTDQDLGTDFIVQIRSKTDDGNYMDEGKVVGVQVKTGNSFVSKKTNIDGVDGYWYSETNKKHYSYWINHSIPHIIILQNDDRSIQVWNYLNVNELCDTGKGFKVFVHRQNIVSDADIRGAIIKYVDDENRKTIKKIVANPNIWSFDINDYDKSDWGRLAMFFPDLVMPHQNKGFKKEINWAEAVALSINIRSREWGYQPKDTHNMDSFAKNFNNVPYIEDAKRNKDYGWRFAAIIHDIVYENDFTFGDELITDSKLPKYLYPAISVVKITRLHNANKFKEITKLTLNVLEIIENSIDRAWILIHQSNAKYELSKFTESKKDLEEAMSILLKESNNLTANILLQVAIRRQTLFQSYGNINLNQIIPANDSNLNRFHTRKKLAALEAYIEDEYKVWGYDKSVTLGGVDTINNQLISISLVDLFEGDVGSAMQDFLWLGMTELLKNTSRNTDGDIGGVLNIIASNNVKELRLALQRICNCADANVLKTIANEILPKDLTPTNIWAYSVVVAEMGNYFTVLNAQKWIKFLLKSLIDKETVNKKYVNPNYPKMWYSDILSALWGVRYFFTTQQAEQLFDELLLFLSDNFQQQRKNVEKLYDYLIQNNLQQFSVKIQQVLHERDKGDSFNDVLKLPLILQDQTSLHEEVVNSNGGLDILINPEFAKEFSSTEAESIIKYLSSKVEEYIESGKIYKGFSFGGAVNTAFHNFISFTLIAGTQSQWKLTIEYLKVTDITNTGRQYIFDLLSKNADKIPKGIAQQILENSDAIKKASVFNRESIFDPGVSIGSYNRLILELTIRLGDDPIKLFNQIYLNSGATTKELVEFMGGHDGFENNLLFLCKSENLEIRETAIQEFVKRIINSEQLYEKYSTVLIELATVNRQLEESGILIGIANCNEIPVRALKVLTIIKNSLSMEIRTIANKDIELINNIDKSNTNNCENLRM